MKKDKNKVECIKAYAISKHPAYFLYIQLLIIYFLLTFLT